MASLASDLVALLPRLRRFARSLTGSAEQADDLVQAACERALRWPEGFTPGIRFDAWMFRILRDLWIDERRRRAARGGIAEPVEDHETLPGADGEAEAEARLGLGEVERALLRLPPEQREAVVLICIEDLSYREAAELTGVPMGTLMSRLARARLALARELGTAKAGDA
jgi:RNA polymerase sigma-70 factor (ECF subfamily)